MGTLQGFIDAVVTELNTISGIKYAPADPPDRLVKWPAAPVWAVTGASRVEFGQVVNYEHDVRIGLLGPAEDLSRLSRVLTAYLEPIIQNIFGKYVASGFTDIEAMGDISYTFGPIEWAGVLQFGFLLTIHDVIIRNTTS
jgi:hypothetical protein